MQDPGAGRDERRRSYGTRDGEGLSRSAAVKTVQDSIGVDLLDEGE